MTYFGGDSAASSADPLAYDPAVDGIFPDEQDPAVASTEQQAAEWGQAVGQISGLEQEIYEPPSYAEDSES